MSDVSISNILPTRTRSGRVRESVPMKPTTPSRPPQKSVTEVVIELEKRYWSVAVRCSELYRRQLSYLKDKGDRSLKFGLMSDYTTLTTEIQNIMGEWSKLPHSFDEIAKWTELVCWKTRVTVFNQSVCIA